MEAKTIGRLTSALPFRATTRFFRIGRPVQEVRDNLLAICGQLIAGSGKAARFTPAHYRAIDIAAGWLTSGNTWGLKIMGGIGTGKSTLMEAIRLFVNDYMQRVPLSERAFVNIFHASDVADAFRADSDICPMFFRYRAVAIDDLGVEPTTVKHYGNEIMPLADILHRRADERKVTIVVTNLNKESIRGRYGERVYDRMRDMTTIILDGQSNRGNHG